MASSSYSVNLNGLLAELGERQIYTFEGVIGDRIYFDGIDADPIFQNISYTLIDPSGATIYTNFDHTADSPPSTLTLAGTYQIVIRSDASTTGDYNFNLIKLNQAPLLTLGTTISDSLTPGLESNVYRFNGTKGQRLQFDSLLSPGTFTSWTLYGPNNQALNSTFTSSGTDFSVTLPTEGEYYLIIDGTNATASVSYSFQVNDISDPPPASPTAFPFTRSGSVSGSPVDFTFTAAAGTLLYFDSLDQDFDGVSIAILDPGGASIASDSASSDFSRVLPRSGTYTVRLNGSGDFNFRLLDVAANATALSLGITVTETITPVSGARIFSFSGALGQRLLYDALDQDFDGIQTFLIGPSGNNLTNLFFVNASSDSEVFTLSETGTYYLVQQPTGQAAADFSFQLLQVPATDLAFDTVTNSTLAPLEIELYRFTGTAGQRLIFDSQSPSAFGANVLLRGPNGESITSSNLASDFEITLTRSGSHILYVDNTSASSIPYSFQLVTPTTTTTALTLGNVVNSSISELGEQDVYTFTGTVGQRLFYDATANNGTNFSATLTSPSGTVVGSTINANFDGSLVTLTETGTYQLLIQGPVGSANSTGNYSFKLIDASAAPTISLDTVTNGSLTPGVESDFFRFTATAGQRLVFDAISSVFTANFRIFDPGNTQIVGSNIGFDTEFTAPEAGTYLLEIEGNSTTPVNYSFQLVSPTTTTAALTLGTPVAGTISELGELDIYTFAGTAGQRLIYDATVNNGTNFLATLTSPSGAVVGSGINGNFDGSLVTLTETGTYQLLIQGQVGGANGTGNYNFNLIDTTAAPTISLDTVTTGTLSPGGESDFYRFTAAAGQRLVFDAISSVFTANFRIFDPGNTQIIGTNIGFDTEFTAPEAGTYLLEIEGNSTTPVNYSFQLVSPTTTTTALTLSSPVAGTINELGERDIYTFTGTVGQRLIYDATANNSNSLIVSLISPSGALVGSTIDTDFDGSLVTLTEAGTYQLIVEGQVSSPNSTGNYNFKLIDAGNAPLITLGTAISGTLTPGAESDLYRFSGTAGQRLNFDSLAAATGANWRLFDPSNGQVPGSGISAGADFVAFLQTTGTYLLEIEGNSASTVSYNFNVTDVSDPAPAAPTILPFSQSGSVSGNTVDVSITIAAGKLLFVDSLDSDFDSVSIQILDTGNFNSQIYSANASSEGSGFVTPRSGNYTVRFTGSGDYNIQIIDLAASSSVLTLDTATNGPLTASATRVFRFTGSVGQRLLYDALEPDSENNSVTLLRPDGSISALNGSAEADRLFALTEAGTHYLLVRNNTASPTDFNFALRDAGAATLLSLDTVTNGSLSPGQESDLYRFTGSAGQRLAFDSLTAGFPSANWNIYGPNNQFLLNGNISQDRELTLTADGTYILQIDGFSTTTVNYSFNLITPTTTTTALSFNTPTSGTISEIGERDIFTFTGAVGQRLYYDNLTNDFTRSFPARLIDPSGDIVLLNQQHFIDSNAPFTLTESGTYQLVLESTSSFSIDTGSYSFQLLDLAAATALSFDTVTNGTLSPGQETDLYRFTGTAGQRLVFDSLTAGSPSANWILYGPTNQFITSGNISQDRDLILTADGTYILQIDGSSSTTINYSFNLITPTTTTTALSFNTATSGTISELGERDIFTFTGSVGQRLYYDALTAGTPGFPVRLIDPTGDLVFLNQQAYVDSNTPFTLTEAGTYQLVLESTSNFSLDTGGYSFQLLDLAAATALSFDTVTSGTLSPGQETDLYRFTGTAGQRLVFDSQTPGFTSANWNLFGPTNQFLVNQNISTDLEFNLTADGTYILAIDGTSASTTNYSFSLVTPTIALTGSPSIIVGDRTGATNTPIALNIAASFASSDANDLRSILISGVPTGATLSAGTNNNNGTWTLTPAQLTGLTITVATAANFALTVTATSAETTGDTATTTATFSVIVNVATGITVTPTNGLVTTEAGGSATFSVVLDSQPTANVTVGISSSDTTEGTTNVSSLTFTPANWNVAQTVIVTGVDDNTIDGTVAYTINTAAATSSDPNYNGFNAANVSVSNSDNDTAGVVLLPNRSLFTSESGGVDIISVRLASQPTANVSISFSSSDLTEGTVSVASLTFTPSNWNVFQNVVVQGVDDSILDGTANYSIITGATSSTDSNYSGLAVADFSVTNSDNDAASFTISDVSIAEGNAGTTTAVFTVTLSNAVAGGASVSYATANGTATAGTDYVATSGTLSFTGTAGEQRTVSVTINGDTTVEPNETFFLNLSLPTNGVTIADTQGIGTITTDDFPPLPVVSLAVSPSSVLENGATNLAYTFSRTGDTSNSLIVNYSIGGSATNGTDYGLITSSVTFAAGSATATVTVDPTPDTVLEIDEAVSLTLLANAAYTIGTPGPVVGTITNDDAAIFSVSDVSIVEGNTGTSLAVFTVTLSNAVAGGAAVSYITGNNTAVAGSDFVPTGGTLNFTGTAGETQTVSVTINGDTVFEPDESFFLFLGYPTSGTTGITFVTGTITNDDAAPLPVISLAVSPASVTENGATNLIYTFTRTGATTNPLTVNYTINGSATNGTDYGLIGNSVTFAAGSATATVTVDPTGDTQLEPNETVSLTLTADPAYLIGTTTAVTGTITNDDAASFSINDVTIGEGNSGTKIALFTVTLNNAVSGGASVSYATADGTATAGSDYLTATGTLNFTGNAGETRTVSVTINGDTNFEPDETFFLNLSAPTNAVTIADSQGLGTIANDDPAPLPVVSLAVSPATVLENGATNLIYTFTRTGATTNPLTVNYAINGTATNGSDYGLIPASVTFAAGAATATVTVDPTGDTVLEPNETVSLTLTADPAYLIGTTAAVTGTIANDDAASFSINDVSIGEGNSGTKIALFTVTLNNAVSGGASVSYATADGTATAGSDYVAASGVLNFTGTAGETRTVSVTINGDTTFEPDESFFLNLSAPTNAVTLLDGQAIGTITNDDPAPLPVISLAVSPASVTENGATNLIYTFTRTGATTNPLTVNYTVNGSATNGTDYGLIGNSITFAAGSATATVTVNPTGDSDVEPDETVSLTLLANAAYAISNTGAVTGTIANDDVGNRAPVFVADPAKTIRPGQTATFTGASLVANDTDPDGNPLSVSQFSAATSQGGSVANTAFDTFTYTPPANFTGTDTFSYVISDGAGGTANATLAINVVNGAPVFVADPAISIRPGQTATINGATLLANDTDPNSDPLSISQFFANTSQGGFVANTAFNTFTYTPSAGFTGTDTFSYVISDGFGGATSATLAINVVNGAPVFVADPAITIRPGQTATINGATLLANDTDPNSDPLSISQFFANTSQGGSVTNTAFNTFTYTPSAGFTGTDTFSYVISDGFGGLTNATLAINVVNGAPVFVADPAITIQPGQTATIIGANLLANDTDPNGDPLSVSQFFANTSQGGSVANTAFDTFTYTPSAGFTGTDTFSYVISDGFGGLTNATLAINVQAKPRVSLAVSPASVAENGTANLIYTFSRTGDSTNPLTVNYAIGGTATNGSDYGLIGSSVTFAAGSSTATLSVDPTGDSVVEADESVSLTLLANAAYTVGTAGAVTGTITNDDAGQVINGTRNRETLTGTDGDDVITGRQGADTIRGNGGADRFVYTSIVDAGDTIIDFNRAQGDKVDLKGALASVGYSGTTPITDGYLRFVARGSDTMLQIDPDGAGLAAARNFILFKNVSLATLSNPDNFIV